jgi:hypothetical protein
MKLISKPQEGKLTGVTVSKEKQISVPSAVFMKVLGYRQCDNSIGKWNLSFCRAGKKLQILKQ